MSAAEKKSAQELLAECSTPIFSAEIGKRLRIVRMKLLLDQRELGQKLGITQQQVSKIESGRPVYLEHPFTTAQFREVVGTHFMFIMFGTNPERYHAGNINRAYWDHKNAPKGNRTTYRMTEAARAELAASHKLSSVKLDKDGKD